MDILKKTISLTTIFLLFSIGCGEKNSLDIWEFRQVGTDKWYPAKIPGTIHTDLLAAGLIPDPFIGTNEQKVQWIEDKDWEYRTIINASKKTLESTQINLTFKGLDTYADIILNDSIIMTTDNMHIPWTKNIKNFLQRGVNELRVYFHSPIKIGQKKLNEHPYLVPTSNEPKPIGEQTSVFTRKAQYHYGWDWGPRLVTSGIWREVTLNSWNIGTISKIDFRTDSINNDYAQIHFTVEGYIKEKIDYKIEFNFFNDHFIEKDHTIKESVKDSIIKFSHLRTYSIKNPKLWWPNGMGEQYQYLYNTNLIINKNIVDSDSGKFSFVDITLNQEKDKNGNNFSFIINKEPIFIKGANYIPPDFFNHRASKKYKRVIKDAVDANMNMLRVWGGGIYENEEFYELCNANGILIWQDFMFACCMIPSGVNEKLDKEFKLVINRLKKHPSIAIWCGNNESLTGWKKWGWQKQYNLHGEDSVKTWNTYNKIFNQHLYFNDSISNNYNYWPSSPSSGKNQLQNKFSGNQHEWGVWFGQLPFNQYSNNAGRFISEYGIQSFPEINTIKMFAPTVDDWSIETKELQFRQRSKMPWISKGYDGFDMINYYINMYFPKPKNIEETIYLSQITQALALQTAAESHRKNKPYTMGTLFWQIDDVWPTISWSTVDYFGNWKAAHYAIKEAYKPIIICADEKNNHLKIHVINDNQEPINGTIKIKLKTLNGIIVKQWEKAIKAEANKNQIFLNIALQNIFKNNKKNSVFVDMKILSNNKIIDSGIHYFVKPKDIALENASIITTIEKNIIKLKSNTLAKNIYLSSNDINGFFSDNFFDLQPNIEKYVSFDAYDNEQITKKSLSVFSLQDISK